MMSRHSSIFNFRALRTLLINLLAFVTGSIALTCALNHVYWQTEEFSRKTWHGFYLQDHIDRLFLGSSHVYCAVNPAVMDEITQKNNFNLSSSDQRLQESYYNLLEANRNYEIEAVFLEVSYLLSTGSHGDYASANSMEVSWRNADYMSLFSPVRYAAIWNMNDSHHYIQALLPFTRFKKYLFNKYFISDNLKRKASDTYKAYQFEEYHEDGDFTVIYRDKGYYENDRLYNAATAFIPERAPEEMHISDDALLYLNKIIQYCQSNGISLTLFATPLWPTEVLSTQNYDDYHASIQTIADHNRIPFYDFNLIQSEYLNLDSPDFFYDSGHLNAAGATAFTTVFANIMNGKYPDTNALFYESFDERMSDLPPTLFGAYINNPNKNFDKLQRIEKNKQKDNIFQIIENGFWEQSNSIESETSTNSRQLCLAATDSMPLEFRVTLSTYADTEQDNSSPVIQDTELYQDYSPNKTIRLPDTGSGECLVEWRTAHDKDTVYTMTLTY